MTQLRFARPHTGSGALIFGADGTASELRLRAQMPAPFARVDVRHSRPMRVLAAMPSVSTSLQLHYDQRVYRGISARAASLHQDAAAGAAPAPQAHQDAARLDAASRALLHDADTSAGQTRVALPSGIARRTVARIGWQGGNALADGMAESWQDRARSAHGCHAHWQGASATDTGAQQGQHDRTRVGQQQRSPWQISHTGTRQGRWHFGAAVSRARGHQTYWREAHPRAGWGGPFTRPPVVVPPDDGCYTPPVGGALLQFLEPLVAGRATLVFRCRRNQGGTIIVPVRRVYMSRNQIEVVTLPARTALDVLDLDISIDVDTWAWQVTGTLPAAQQDLVAPSGGAPVEIEVTVNGVQWVFVIDRPTRSRVFGRARTRFTGRSRAAYLADPYDVAVSRSNTAPATAQQLILDALPPDWSLLWQASDWLVPAGAWSHRGTAIDVATTVVGAIRGQVHAHRVDKQLRVSARYPIAPWSWAAATPDITLPISVVTSEDTEWQELPPYNRVFVSGTSHGVLAQVTRDGTAGDVLAEMVTDALITDDLAASQRGIAELARGGRQAMVSIDVPLLPTGGLGLIECGRLLQVVEGAEAWTGMVRGVQVQPGRTKVRQRLRVERQ